MIICVRIANLRTEKKENRLSHSSESGSADFI